MEKITLILVMVFFSMTASASKNFKCTVLDAVTFGKDGTLSHSTAVAKSKIGEEFTVNRQSGQITGGGLVNTMSGEMPVVYNYLPNENGYKAITIYKPNQTVDYLQINEYLEGRKKPFFYKEAWGTTLSGLCTYY